MSWSSGDSLVDAGNVHLITRGRWAGPAQGYVAGRFTNSFTFADRFAMGIGRRVTTPSRSGGNNYAYGGARDDGVPDVMAQVEEWRRSLRGRPDPATLFILPSAATIYADPAVHPPGSKPTMTKWREAMRARCGRCSRTPREPSSSPAPRFRTRRAKTSSGGNAKSDRMELGEGQRLLRYDLLPFWRKLLAEAPQLGFRP